MAEKDLPSHSDDSDEDFVPDANCSSAEEGEDDVEDEVSAHDNSGESSDEGKGPKSRKRRKVSRKKRRKKGGEDEASGEKEEEVEKSEKVTDVDSLWADFKEDVSKMEKQRLSNQEKTEEKEVDSAKVEKKEEEVAGESNSASKTVPVDNKRRCIASSVNSNSSKLGLSKILNQIGKKDKMSTLAKSKLDWNNFKKSEGIEDEIKTYNKGKDGYLEKQDFLQRTDLRQFELEKQLRASRRNF